MMHSAHGSVDHPREAANQSLLPTNLKVGFQTSVRMLHAERGKMQAGRQGVREYESGCLNEYSQLLLL